jgi:hypothetical protein
MDVEEGPVSPEQLPLVTMYGGANHASPVGI